MSRPPETPAQQNLLLPLVGKSRTEASALQISGLDGRAIGIQNDNIAAPFCIPDASHGREAGRRLDRAMLDESR